VAPAPNHPPWDARTFAPRVDPTCSGAASCSVSVELTEPWLLSAGALKEHVSPSGIVEGQENVSGSCSQYREPFGVAVTVTMPVVFGASDKEDGLVVVVNDPDRDTVRGATFAAA